MAERYSQEEHGYYQSVVEKAAEKGRPYIDDDAQLDKLVKDIGEAHDLHEDLMLRFKRDVDRRIQEMWNTAQSEQERRVIEEYEGYVKVVNGKYQPTGIDEEFKFTVRPGIQWSWGDIRNIWDGIFGRRIDTEEFHKIIESTEAARESLEASRRDLELLKASQKSTKELLSLGASGFFHRFRQPKSGIFSPIGGGLKDMWEGYRNNKQAAVEMKETEKLIKKKSKELEHEEKLRDAVLAKIEGMREQSRSLFSKTFQKEIDALLDQQANMSTTEFDEKKEKLRQKVDTWCERTGFMHMKVFFREEFGEEPGMEEPVSPLEAKKRDLLVSRFCRDIIGDQPPEGLTREVSRLLKRHDPQILQLIHEKRYPKDAMDVLCFLFQGKLGSIKITPRSRVMSADAEDISEYVSLALDYVHEAGSELPRVLHEFAEQWKGKNTSDFDEVFDLILHKKQPLKQEESDKDLQKQRLEQIQLVSSHWKDVTGEDISDDNAELLLQALMADPSIASRLKPFMKNEKKKAFMRVMFQGFFQDKKKTVVANDERLISAGLQSYFEMLFYVDVIAKNYTEDFDDWEKVIQVFLRDPQYKNLNLLALTPEVFQQILHNIKDQPTREQAQHQAILEDLQKAQQDAHDAQQDTLKAQQDVDTLLKELGILKQVMQASQDEMVAARARVEHEQQKREKAEKKLKKVKRKVKQKKTDHTDRPGGGDGSGILNMNVMNVQFNKKTKGSSTSPPSTPSTESEPEQPTEVETEGEAEVESMPRTPHPLEGTAPPPLLNEAPEDEYQNLNRDERRILHTFSLGDNLALAKQLYHDIFEEQPEWISMFQKKKNRQMLRFLMSGKLRKMSLTPPDLEGEAKRAYIDNVLELLPFLDKSSIYGLEQDYKKFSRKNKDLTCQAFLAFLRTTYKDFL